MHFDQVSPSNTLITPVHCKALWRQFKAETEYTVTQAISAQVFSMKVSSFRLVQNAGRIQWFFYFSSHYWHILYMLASLVCLFNLSAHQGYIKLICLDGMRTSMYQQFFVRGKHNNKCTIAPNN